MSKKQYKAAAVCAISLFGLFFAAPALAELDHLLAALAVGAVSLAVMAAAVFKGGLTDVENL